MTYLKITFLCFSILLFSAVKSKKTTTLQGIYRINYTEKDGFIILTKDSISKNIRLNGFRKFIFNPNNEFNDKREPPCGNDIGWSKKGKYAIRDSKLLLNYTSGNISDGLEDSTILLFQSGKVIYKIIKIKKDSIFLEHLSGVSEIAKVNPNYRARR